MEKMLQKEKEELEARRSYPPRGTPLSAAFKQSPLQSVTLGGSAEFTTPFFVSLPSNLQELTFQSAWWHAAGESSSLREALPNLRKLVWTDLLNLDGQDKAMIKHLFETAPNTLQEVEISDGLCFSRNGLAGWLEVFFTANSPVNKWSFPITYGSYKEKLGSTMTELAATIEAWGRQHPNGEIWIPEGVETPESLNQWVRRL